MKLYIGDYCPDEPDFQRVVTAEDVIKLRDQKNEAVRNLAASNELIAILHSEIERLTQDLDQLAKDYAAANAVLAKTGPHYTKDATEGV